MPESISALISGEIVELGGVGIFLSFLLFGEVVVFAAAMLIQAFFSKGCRRYRMILKREGCSEKCVAS